MPEPSPLVQVDMGLQLLPEIRSVYLDSSVFLAHIKGERLVAFAGRSRVEITAAIFEAARNGQFKIYTSFFTLAEVRRIRGQAEALGDDEIDRVNSLFQEFLEHDYIYAIEVNREIAEKAQSLGARFNLTPTDAVHMASAIVAGCSMAFAWDKGTWLSKFPGGECEGVKLFEPYWQGAFPLTMPEIAISPGTAEAASQDQEDSIGTEINGGDADKEAAPTEQVTVSDVDPMPAGTAPSRTAPTSDSAMTRSTQTIPTEEAEPKPPLVDSRSDNLPPSDPS